MTMKSRILTISVGTLLGAALIGCGTEELQALSGAGSGGQMNGKGASLVDASSGGELASSTPRGRCYSADRHEKAVQALTAGDYAAWREVMSENECHPRVLDVVNETNFARFAEAYKLAADGKIAEADVIRTELGLPKLADRGNGQAGACDGSRKGQGKGKGQGQGYGSGK
jgi:hypothetical protein